MEAREYLAFTAGNVPKAGDKVIMINGRSPERVLTIKKVTPTELVKTEEGITYRRIDNGEYIQRGGGWIYTKRYVFTRIVPYTDALAEQVREYQRKQDEEATQRRVVEKARGACRVMADAGSALPYDVAAKLLEVYEAWKEGRT